MDFDQLGRKTSFISITFQRINSGVLLGLSDWQMGLEVNLCGLGSLYISESLDYPPKRGAEDSAHSFVPRADKSRH